MNVLSASLQAISIAFNEALSESARSLAYAPEISREKANEHPHQQPIS